MWPAFCLRALLSIASLGSVQAFLAFGNERIIIIHLLLLGDGKGELEEMLERIVNNRVVVNNWKTCRLLIIDEISMLDAERFDKLEAIARAIRLIFSIRYHLFSSIHSVSVRKSKLPFGGIQLVLCGDFLQLPPVGETDQASKIRNPVRMCYHATSWDKCIDQSIKLHHVSLSRLSPFALSFSHLVLSELPQRR